MFRRTACCLSRAAAAPVARSLHTGRPATAFLLASSKHAIPRLSHTTLSSRIFVPPSLVRGYAEVIKVPPMAESITEGTLASFSKAVGDFVEADEEVASIETDKIDVPVNAPFSGTITELCAKPEDTVEVDQPLFKMEKGEGKPKEAAESKPKDAAESKPAPAKEESESKPAPAEAKSTPSETEEPKPAASKPAASKPAASQPAASPKKEASSASGAAPAVGSVFSASRGPTRDENRVKMNRMRLRIAERLKESQNTAASLTTFQECDMSAVMEMRKLYKDEVIKRTGVKIGFMGVFTKAATLAMREVPAVNAAIDGGDLVFRDYVDVSIAVATPKGLVTPVIRNAESLDVIGLEAEIVNLGTKARDGKLSIEDMAGGTFTISNGGVFGSLMGTPIINMPQCAVLGLHGVKDRPVAVNGQVVIRPMMYLALTYDHRIVDGREAVTFLRMVKEYIEDPRRMLLA